MSVKSVLSSTAVLVLGALALTGCQSGSTTAVGGSAPSQQTPVTPAVSRSAAPVSAPSAPVTAPSATVSAVRSSSSGNSSGGNSSGGSRAGGNADSDSYAYTHPCSNRQLSVHVARRDSAPTQRVIEVRNVGAQSCGLSYYPLIDLDDSHAADGSQAVKPLIPSGLGGAPAYPVYAGQTAYAVVDLDPSGATTGTVKGIDELNVLADGNHMPDADTLNFPLGSGALVLKPKLGLYQSTVVDAVAAMRAADTQS
ncbi:DUF4232 domain-containing protein [Streptomyces sp. NPDC092296]|uniref:DUF4232 domain-containing protein n=1 Tax=Streptomyces sp. NPDC092296 TaxID=3366012 RepID=UPI0037FAE39E